MRAVPLLTYDNNVLPQRYYKIPNNPYIMHKSPLYEDFCVFSYLYFYFKVLKQKLSYSFHITITIACYNTIVLEREQYYIFSPFLEIINVSPALIIKIPIIPISWQRTLCTPEGSLFFQENKTDRLNAVSFADFN